MVIVCTTIGVGESLESCTHHGSLKRGHTALQPVKFTYGGMENASYEYNGRFSFLSVVHRISYAHTDAPTTTIS